MKRLIERLTESSYVIVAPYGKNIDNLYKSVSLLPTKRLYLINISGRVKKECENYADLDEAMPYFNKLKLHVLVKQLSNNLWEDAFRIVSEVKDVEKNEQVLVNVSSADERCRCAFTCASYVNGLRAFEIVNDGVNLLPIFKFSFVPLLTDKKIKVLNTIVESGEQGLTLLQLAENAGMSLPLAYYHVNGNSRVEGLRQLGLVELTEKRQSVVVSLTTFGKLMIRSAGTGSPTTCSTC